MSLLAIPLTLNVDDNSPMADQLRWMRGAMVLLTDVRAVLVLLAEHAYAQIVECCRRDIAEVVGWFAERVKQRQKRAFWSQLFQLKQSPTGVHTERITRVLEWAVAQEGTPHLLEQLLHAAAQSLRTADTDDDSVAVEPASELPLLFSRLVLGDALGRATVTGAATWLTTSHYQPSDVHDRADIQMIISLLEWDKSNVMLAVRKQHVQVGDDINSAIGQITDLRNTVCGHTATCKLSKERARLEIGKLNHHMARLHACVVRLLGKAAATPMLQQLQARIDATLALTLVFATVQSATAAVVNRWFAHDSWRRFHSSDAWREWIELHDPSNTSANASNPNASAAETDTTPSPLLCELEALVAAGVFIGPDRVDNDAAYCVWMRQICANLHNQHGEAAPGLLAVRLSAAVAKNAGQPFTLLLWPNETYGDGITMRKLSVKHSYSSSGCSEFSVTANRHGAVVRAATMGELLAGVCAVRGDGMRLFNAQLLGVSECLVDDYAYDEEAQTAT